MMNAFFKGVAAAAVAASVPAIALAATQTGSASVDIVSNLNVVQDQALDFGFVVSGSAASAVTVAATAAGTDVATGDGTATGATPLNGSQRGQFTVSGTAGETVTISTDASTTLSNGNSANDMLLTLAADQVGTQTLDDGASSDSHIFYVGGALAVGGNQASGAYSGSYSVTVNYQ